MCARRGWSSELARRVRSSALYYTFDEASSQLSRKRWMDVVWTLVVFRIVFFRTPGGGGFDSLPDVGPHGSIEFARSFGLVVWLERSVSWNRVPVASRRCGSRIRNARWRKIGIFDSIRRYLILDLWDSWRFLEILGQMEGEILTLRYVL